MSRSAEISTDCRSIDTELDQALIARAQNAGTWPLSAQAREHIRTCNRCRQLYAWLFDPTPSAESSPDVYRRVQQQLKNSLTPVAPQAAPPVLAAQFLVVFLLFASPAVALMGTAGLREMSALQLLGIGSVLFCGAALLSWSLAWQMTPGSLHRVPARVAVVTLSAGFLAGIAILFPWNAPEAFLMRGWTCLKTGIIMAFPAALLFWLLVRRGYVMASGMLGGTLGAIAGLLGITVLQLTCDRQEAAHLMVWHGGVLLVSTCLGIAVGRVIDRVGRNTA